MPVSDAGEPQDALPSCWNFTCPDDPTATTCGTCRHPLNDLECVPGFVCSCTAVCVKGPRSYDASPACYRDAGPGIDAAVYDWPACDDRHKDARAAGR